MLTELEIALCVFSRARQWLILREVILSNFMAGILTSVMLCQIRLTGSLKHIEGKKIVKPLTIKN